MHIEQTGLNGCWLLQDRLYKDERGYFTELYNCRHFQEATGLNIAFVQDNLSYSVRGVLRGLHFQRGEAAQAKWVRVLQGAVLDVAVDLRKESPTFGRHYAVVLSAQTNTSLFIPRGFGHGFVVLSDSALFFYKCDNYYNKEADGGILYSDPELAIDWRLPAAELIVSEKDQQLPPLHVYQQSA